MTRTVAEAGIDVTKPGEATVNQNVPGSDIFQVDVKKRLQDLLDPGEINLHNHAAAYTGEITRGDKIEFNARLEGEASKRTIWTGIIDDIEHDVVSPSRQMLNIKAKDFVFWVLGHRIVVNVFQDRQLSGSSDAVLEKILTNNAEEIGQAKIETINTKVNVEWNAARLIDAVRFLAKRGDALVGQSGEDIVFKPLGSPPVEWTLKASDRGLPTVNKIGSTLTNYYQVEGGHDNKIDVSQETQDTTETVTSSNRIKQQISPRKSEIAIVEIYTELTGSGDNLVVRLQSDDGSGSPIDLSSRESDPANRTLAADFLEDGGWTSFLMKSHAFAPNVDPWIIVESDGSTGQKVGTDSNGTLAYKAHYPYPLASIVDDEDSIAEFRRREESIHDDSLKTKKQTEQRGDAELRHSSDGDSTISFPARSTRAHQLDIGEVISVDESDLDFVADAIVTQVADVYDGERDELTTTITAKDVTTV